MGPWGRRQCQTLGHLKEDKKPDCDKGDMPAAKEAKASKRPAAAAMRRLASAPASKKAKGSKACIGMEKNRSQVRCRRSDGTSFAIPWGYRNGQWVKSEHQAVAEAKAWLEKED